MANPNLFSNSIKINIRNSRAATGTANVQYLAADMPAALQGILGRDMTNPTMLAFVGQSAKFVLA